MRYALAIAGLCFGLCCFVAGFAVAYYRVPPYHRIQQLLGPPSERVVHTPPEYPLWRDSYRQTHGMTGVVMFGDSITRFGNWTVLLGRSDVINLGIPGDTTYGMLYRLDDGNIPEGSTVFVLAGVNDMIRSIPVDQTLGNLEKIVRRLGPRRAVFLQSTLFTNRAGLNKDIRRLAAGQRDICARLGCTFVDLNAGLAPEGVLPDRFDTDGVHLSEAGYARWAGILRGHLPPPK